jgi:hypothetical protein
MVTHRNGRSVWRRPVADSNSDTYTHAYAYAYTYADTNPDSNSYTDAGAG